MIKTAFALLIYCFTAICFASSCPTALPTTDPGFCSTFVAAGTCYCANSLPKKMCSDMGQIHKRMISMFGTIERACNFQRETPAKTCVDDWNCYLFGNRDSQGGLCSGTGKACV